MVIAVILTFNSEKTLRQVVESCKAMSSRVVVVDSFSTDSTLAVAESCGCEILQHPFENYSRQRNWAQENIGAKPEDWILHLDSDEVVSPTLQASISAAVGGTSSKVASPCST